MQSTDEDIYVCYEGENPRKERITAARCDETRRSAAALDLTRNGLGCMPAGLPTVLLALAGLCIGLCSGETDGDRDAMPIGLAVTAAAATAAGAQAGSAAGSGAAAGILVVYLQAQSM